MFSSNILLLVQSVTTLILAGLLTYLWQTVRRLHQTVRQLERHLDSAPAPTAPPSAAPAPAPVPALRQASVAEEMDPGVLAAIAAAVAVVVRQPHRIIAIQPDTSAQRAWSSEGRRELYHSHRVR
jgi:hypothetical protein